MIEKERNSNHLNSGQNSIWLYKTYHSDERNASIHLNSDRNLAKLGIYYYQGNYIPNPENGLFPTFPDKTGHGSTRQWLAWLSIENSKKGVTPFGRGEPQIFSCNSVRCHECKTFTTENWSQEALVMRNTFFGVFFVPTCMTTCSQRGTVKIIFEYTNPLLT